MIQFLDMNSKKIIKIIEFIFFSNFKDGMILMNENDLFLLGKEKITILDIEKKEINNKRNQIRWRRLFIFYV